MNRTVILGGVLVILIGVSAYMWSRSSEQQADQRIAQKTDSWTCKNCGHVFELTIAQSTEMQRTGGIICPSCSQAAGEKTDPEFVIGGFGDASKAAEEPADEAEEDMPSATGGMTPKGG